MRFGRHMSRSEDALAHAQEIGCEAVQIFVTNPRAWSSPEPAAKALAAFRETTARYGLRPVVVHAAYIINLASPHDELFEKSVEALRATLARAAHFDAESVVFHVGSHSGAGEEAGLGRLAEGVRRVLDGAPPSVRLLLENDTGGGGKLGARFENLARVLDALPAHAPRLGVCLDTAHLWGAGYDIGTAAGTQGTLDEAERTLGLGRVSVLHVNDARAAFASHRDIHARLGEGTIGLEGMAAFLQAPGLLHTTALLETPYCETEAGEHDWEAERAHLARACALAGRGAPPEVAGAATTNDGA